jgi:hypothetical protein
MRLAAAACCLATSLALPVTRAGTVPSLGTNLAPVTDFTAEYPFVNHFKQAMPWVSGKKFGTFDDGRRLKLDANGYVKELARGQVANSVLFTGDAVDPDLVGRRFILSWGGKGKMSLGGAVDQDTISFGTNRIEFTLETANPGEQPTIILTLLKTDPSKRVKNIKLVPTGGVCASDPQTAVDGTGDCSGDFLSFETDTDAIMFNPQFLANTAPYRSVRFMDWMRTNDSNQQDFAKRPKISNAFWSTDRGVPLEVMIRLANDLDIDPWFNIPHKASDAYVQAFATIVRDQLETDRDAYFEYSNEVWNSIFDQTTYARNRGVELGLDADETTAMVKFYSRRSRQVFELIESAFGGTDRIQRVMATQVVVPFFTEEILGFENAASSTDAFAVAPYFGTTISEQSVADAIKAAGVDGVFDWLNNDNNAAIGDYGALASVAAAVADQVDAAGDAGVPLIAYEGGQHFIGFLGFENDSDLNEILDDVNRDPRMKDVYLDYLEDFATTTGGQPFWHYVNCDRWSKFGRWGALEYPTQPRAASPKYDALQTFIESP